MTEPSTTSTRPYLIRAIHEWCTDNGFTPYLAVNVDASVQVPAEFVNNGEIVLNVGYDATGSMQLGNEFIEFKARFGGKPRDIMIPVGRVQAIYSRETGQGMSFPVVEDFEVDLVHGLAALDAFEAADDVAELDDVAVSAGPVIQLVTSQAVPSGGDEPPHPHVAPIKAGRPSLKLVK